ncbi:MAG: TIM barrel protein [Acidimicrobiia bacterium]|nr:TIM barrel protein [Acidimicrobiia bacterium]
MVRLAANISMMFTEEAPVDRVRAAHAAGFGAVECQFPYAWDLGQLREAQADTGVEWVLLNTAAGDAEAGERGLACLDGRTDDFRASVERALRWAVALRCGRVHVMAGIAADPGALDRYVANLRWAADRLASEGLVGTIEPLNQRDTPRYFLTTVEQAARVIDRVGRDNLRIQFDTYHVQISQGDVLERFQRFLPLIGHVQISGPPFRYEPDWGELDHHWLLAAFDAAGYDGWIGCEYRPRETTQDGLGWASRYGISTGPATPSGGIG